MLCGYGCKYLTDAFDMLRRYGLAAETTFLGIFDGELMNTVIWGWEPKNRLRFVIPLGGFSVQ